MSEITRVGEKVRHQVDVLTCEKNGYCQFQKDISIVTKHGGIHKFLVVCEKIFAYKTKSVECYALLDCRIDATITIRKERKINDVRKKTDSEE